MLDGVRTVWSRAGVEWRVFTHGPWEWLLVSGHRLIVSAAILLGMLVLLDLAVRTGLVGLEEETAMLFVLFALISGNVTLIAIVVSLSQFVLARHLETPGEIREKIDDMIRYRQEVGETAQQSVVPISPSSFFLTLFEGIRRELRVLDRRIEAAAAGTDGDAPGGSYGADLEAVVDGLGGHTAYVIGILERPETGLRHALYTTLSADYETYIHAAWSLKAEHGEELPSTASVGLDRLVATLEQVEIARRSFKSVFIQDELASLSRLLLLVGLPALVLLIVVMLLFSAPTRPIVYDGFIRTTFPFVLAVGFAPIVLLAAYIVRLATVAHRTAALYPFSRHA